MKLSQNNLVAHCVNRNYKGYNKVYIVSVTRASSEAKLVAKIGKRDHDMKETIHYTLPNHIRADRDARTLFARILGKGYENISSPEYEGTLTYDDPWLRCFLEIFGEVQVEEPGKLELKSVVTFGKPFKVVCLDNIGLGERLMVDKEYIAKAHSKYPGMIVVTHDDGEEQECFGWRFRIKE